MTKFSDIKPLKIQTVNGIKVGQVFNDPTHKGKGRIAKIQFFYADGDKIMAHFCQISTKTHKMTGKMNWFSVDITTLN